MIIPPPSWIFPSRPPRGLKEDLGPPRPLTVLDLYFLVGALVFFVSISATFIAADVYYDGSVFAGLLAAVTAFAVMFYLLAVSPLLLGVMLGLSWGVFAYSAIVKVFPIWLGINIGATACAAIIFIAYKIEIEFRAQQRSRVGGGR